MDQMNVGQQIAAAMAAIEQDAAREKYRAAMKILRTVPNGTRDEDLTDEQRQAWQDHDAALASFRRNS